MNIDIFEDIDDAENAHHIVVRVPKRYIRNEDDNPMRFYTDHEFKKRYRFSKETVQHIILPLLDNIQYINRRGLPVSPLMMLLISLRFYATGTFQVN